MANNTIPSDAPGIFVGLGNTPQGQALVTPSTLPAGVAGFVFDIEGEDNIELRSEITDHYVETNTTIQDQWGRLPERITLRGYVGELVDYFSRTLAPQTSLPAALPINSAMVPSLQPGSGTPAPVTAQTATAANSQSLFSYYQGTATAQTEQGLAFGFFYQLWLSAQTCSVETPWGVFTNMAIENLRVTQMDDSKYITDFMVTFKKIRYASTAAINPSPVAGRAFAYGQESNPTQNGNVGLLPTGNDLLFPSQ